MLRATMKETSIYVRTRKTQLLFMFGQQIHTNTRLHIISRDALHSGVMLPGPCFPLLAATLLIDALALVAFVVGDLVVRGAG